MHKERTGKGIEWRPVGEAPDPRIGHLEISARSPANCSAIRRGWNAYGATADHVSHSATGV